MNKIFIIAKNELSQFFTLLSNYIVVAVFVFINAWFFTISLFTTGVVNLDAYFRTVQVAFVVFIPIITMNLITKEKQTGTIEIFYTLPIRIGDFILGKYLASLMIVMLSLTPSIVHILTIYFTGTSFDLGVVFCVYLSLVLTAAVYCGIGVFAGSIASHQVASFLVSYLLIAVFFLFEYLIAHAPMILAPVLKYLSITWQASQLIRGVIDTRILIYFSSLIFIFLWSATNYMKTRSNSK